MKITHLSGYGTSKDIDSGAKAQEVLIEKIQRDADAEKQRIRDCSDFFEFADGVCSGFADSSTWEREKRWANWGVCPYMHRIEIQIGLGPQDKLVDVSRSISKIFHSQGFRCDSVNGEQKDYRKIHNNKTFIILVNFTLPEKGRCRKVKIGGVPDHIIKQYPPVTYQVVCDDSLVEPELMEND